MFTNLASKLFLNGNENNNGQPQGNGFPYLKFAWEVELAGKGLASGPLVAKTCELPRWSTDTQIVNVYNHKTLVQTKFNFEPITISFYDQCNNVADSVIWGFVKGQFDSTDGSKAPTFSGLTIKITQKNLSGPGAADKVYTLTNAFITDAQHDTLDYSASDVVLWTLTIRYENLDTEGFSGTAPESATGIKPSPEPPESITPTPLTPPAKKPPDAQIDKPPVEIPKPTPPITDGWNQNGGNEVTRSDKPDPYAAVTGIPRGRLGFHKLPGDVGYQTPQQLQFKAPSWWPFSRNNSTSQSNKMASMTFEATSATPQQGTGGVATTLAISSDDNTAKDQTFNPNTGTNSLATTALQFNSATTSQETDYVSKQISTANLNTSLNLDWRNAYISALTANPPVDNTPHAQKIANDNAKKIASQTATMYAPQTRLNDIGVIINKENTLTKEPTGPAVVNGYSVPNANDPRSGILSNQQATREQKYQLQNPIKDTNGY